MNSFEDEVFSTVGSSDNEGGLPKEGFPYSPDASRGWLSSNLGGRLGAHGAVIGGAGFANNAYVAVLDASASVDLEESRQNILKFLFPPTPTNPQHHLSLSNS